MPRNVNKQDWLKDLTEKSSILHDNPSLKDEFTVIVEALNAQKIKVFANYSNSKHASLWLIKRGKTNGWLAINAVGTWEVSPEFGWDVMEYLEEFGYRSD